MQQASQAWAAYNGAFAWIAAITISCALGGVMGGIGNGADFTVCPSCSAWPRQTRDFSRVCCPSHWLDLAIGWIAGRSACALCFRCLHVRGSLSSHTLTVRSAQAGPPTAFLAANKDNGATAVPSVWSFPRQRRRARRPRVFWGHMRPLRLPRHCGPALSRPARAPARSPRRCCSTAAGPAFDAAQHAEPVGLLCCHTPYAAGFLLPPRPDAFAAKLSALGLLFLDSLAVTHRGVRHDRHRRDADAPRWRLL